MDSNPVALIVDIVRSRELDDREAAQAAIHSAFDTASTSGRVLQSLRSTVGDEFQAVFADITGALRATAIARLSLPDGVDCRFGLGRGEIREIDQRAGAIQDGSAWWRARAAIEEAHNREDKKNPFLRGWFVSEATSSEFNSLVNAFLLMRDNTISTMSFRERRLTAGVLLGQPQVDLARAEKITQSAVSQSLQKSGGGALLAAQQLFEAACSDGAAR